MSRRYVFSQGEGNTTRIDEGLAPIVVGDEQMGLHVKQVFATAGPASMVEVSAAKSDNYPLNKSPALGEALFLIATVPPATADPEIIKASQYMHSDPTVDFGVVLSGEADVHFVDGSHVHLTAGDSYVLGGVLHSWRNSSDKPFVFAAVLVGARGTPQRADADS